MNGKCFLKHNIMSVFAFILSLLAGTTLGPVTEASVSEQPTVTLEITLCDGSVLETFVDESDVSTFNPTEIGINASDYFECTAKASDGTCETTGPTCDAAVAGVIACLKEANGESGPSEDPEE